MVTLVQIRKYLKDKYILQGIPLQCEVQGSIDMKCFLIGAPEVRIGFNEGVTLDKQEIKGKLLIW